MNHEVVVLLNASMRHRANELQPRAAGIQEDATGHEAEN